jgi:hypothetical protein
VAALTVNCGLGTVGVLAQPVQPTTIVITAPQKNPSGRLASKRSVHPELGNPARGVEGAREAVTQTSFAWPRNHLDQSVESMSKYFMKLRQTIFFLILPNEMIFYLN